MKSPSVHYRRRSKRHKGMKKGDPPIELSVSPKDSSKRPKVVASSEETTVASPSNTVVSHYEVSHVAIEDLEEANDVIMEEVVASEIMEEVVTTSDA
ncbi:hypothetical protein L6452_00777 [Arctium lappa]|uniref:Uncharacterized protein n=1 Tax=Arctium lappa TaxID=4217 RepID=A0ACB9FFU2_ARCLA|nr:hypothetical protein L6452_00777 [Arctium lappa]